MGKRNNPAVIVNELYIDEKYAKTNKKKEHKPVRHLSIKSTTVFKN